MPPKKLLVISTFAFTGPRSRPDELSRRSPKPIASRSSRRGRRNATVRRPTRVYDLPTELISEIFLSYHRITQAPILLLLVCRHWRDIALSISALWSTIRWMKHENLPLIEETMYCPLTCLSWSQLERAACRAGEARLSIISDLQMFGIYAETNNNIRSWFSTRCRSLRITLRYGQWETLENLVTSFREMSNLEELSLNSYSNWAVSNISGRILENVEKGNPRLVNLELIGHFPYSLVNRRSMLKHLRKLSISKIFRLSDEHLYAQMIEQLINLEELTWPFDTPPELKYISGNLHSLNIGCCRTFPGMPYGRLTSLTLSCASGVFAQDQDVVELAFLRDLTFSGYWARFILLRAPILTHLNFECWDLGDRDLASQVWIHPRSLTITNKIAEEKLIELLAGIWSEVEEIHWVYLRSQPVMLGRKLTIALGGSKNDAPLCPHLRHLTMKTTNPIHLNNSMTDRVELRLRAIVRERQRYGKGLHSVRWLWYPFRPRFATGLEEECESGFTIL